MGLQYSVTDMTTAFLSSTSRDLAPYREAAYRGVEKLNGYHCVRMEDFTAANAAPIEVCLTKVRGCDVFLGIIGHIHGSCPPSHEESYTEMEFAEACRQGIPTLIFMCPEDFPVAANLRERDEKYRRQRVFRARVDCSRVRASFTSPEELSSAVIAAIHNWEDDIRCTRTAAVYDQVQRVLGTIMPKWEVLGVPLGDCIQFLRDITYLNIHVCWEVLFQDSVDMNTPVSVSLMQVPVRAILRTMLLQVSTVHALTAVAQEGIVYITTQDHATFAIPNAVPILDRT